MKTAIVYESTHHGNTKKFAMPLRKNLTFSFLTLKMKFHLLTNLILSELRLEFHLENFTKIFLKELLIFCRKTKKCFLFLLLEVRANLMRMLLRKLRNPKTANVLALISAKDLTLTDRLKLWAE